VRQHAFFASIDWVKLEAREVEPPFKPKLRSAKDVGNFDSDFTSEKVTLTPTNAKIIDGIDQAEFKGFTYVEATFV